MVVRGKYSAVRLWNLSGGAEVETTHGRITILNVGPTVNARAMEGIVDYAGHEGRVRLYGSWEVNSKFTARTFEGTLEATSEGALRVLLPPGFATAFEASVAKDAAFVCRADMGGQILRREEGERVIYSFGEESPAIRLMAVKGPIVMDSSEGPWDEAAVNAMLRPRSPMLRAQASLKTPYIS